MENKLLRVSAQDYIKALAQNSKTKEHELLYECLNLFGVKGTRDLTLDQLKNFCELKFVGKTDEIISENFRKDEEIWKLTGGILNKTHLFL